MNVLIDAKNLLFRAHFAHKELRDSKDRPTGALYGFLDSYRAIRKAIPIARFIVCWENGCLCSRNIATGGGQVTWRKQVFPDYKANRHTANDENYKEAIEQIPAIIEALDLLGPYQFEIPGLEADDLISLLAATTQEETVVYSHDGDLFQLLAHPHVQLARPKPPGYATVSAKEFEKKFHVTATEWPKYRALAGDTSDNIKVLKGVGPVGALKLLRAGVNPATATFAELPLKVRKANSSLREHWEKLHAAYRISALPQSVDDIPSLSRQQKTIINFELHQALNFQTAYTQTDFGLRAQAFTRFCSDFDIVNFLGYVGNFFPLN